MQGRFPIPEALMAVLLSLGCILVSRVGTPELVPTGAPPEPSPLYPTLSKVAAPPAAVIGPTPPPQADWPVYQNNVHGFGLRYPPDGAIASEAAETTRVDLPFAPGTNLKEKYLQIDARSSAGPCVSPLASGWDPEALPTETRVIGGSNFSVQSGGEGAAGSFYMWTAYAVTQGDVCVTLSFVLHSTNAMNYTPPLAEFDEPTEGAVFDEVVSTFVWLGP